MPPLHRLAAVGAIASLVGSIGMAVGAPVATGQVAAEPAPLPRANCGPGSSPEPDLQGRVPASEVKSGAALDGYRCNLEQVGRHGNSGGYKVHRHVDASGRECAYYDAALLFPTGILTHEEGPGVHVLDMSDPSAPELTASLVTPAMQSPHESLLLHEGRGLLIAAMGSPASNLGIVDIYDVSEDCREPQLLHSSPLGILGHESGISPDGNTLWVTSTAARTIVALDITDPRVPVPLWTGTSWFAHGVRISEDGTRLYSADAAGRKGLTILDVSEVQARVPNPEVSEISHLTWPEASIPQVAIPVRIDGHEYLVEIDEFGRGGPVGAGRIIDIADETTPQVVSNLRLEVNQREAQQSTAGDPGTSSPVQGYAGHYCNVPQREDPGIVACSFIASGLRVFDIRDPHKPREIAYFNKPVEGTFAGDRPASYAMSSPAFVPERGEIWYADANSGLWILRFTNDVWPFVAAAEEPVSGDEPGRVRPEVTGRILPATGGSSGFLAGGAALLLMAAGLGRRGRRLTPSRPRRRSWRGALRGQVPQGSVSCSAAVCAGSMCSGWSASVSGNQSQAS